jgi:hypothetical protein
MMVDTRSEKYKQPILYLPALSSEDELHFNEEIIFQVYMCFVSSQF